MKAMLSRSPGPPETLTLEEVPDPVPGPGEVLIRVAACGVNFPDSLIIEDKYQVRPERPFAPGSEVAGTVESIGNQVSTLRVGDRVMGICSWGGMAEKLVLAAKRCTRIPDAMPFEAAAALQLTYGTAHFGLKRRGRLMRGETLLVLGAAGGVGLAAVELGKAAGARVIAAVSSESKAAAAAAAGANRTVVYPVGPFDAAGRKALAALFRAACGPEGANVVFDPVGGDYAEASLRAMAQEGRFLVVGFPAGIPNMPLNLVLLKGCQIAGVDWGALVARSPEECREFIGDLLDFYAQRKIKPRISERLPLARAGEAIARLAARQAVGKIVILVQDA
jgi:NADPH2:quinone reductase